ncbi:MAG: glycosyltransferase [bacterium]|nr:glycosyltransferase [bacterium]
MRLLIAPLHYIADPSEGSEYTRSYNYLKYFALKEDLHGDILVGYTEKKTFGNLNVFCYFKTKPDYISNFMRIKFIIWTYYKANQLIKKNKYDLIWHNGPFAINETFSLLAIFNNKKIPFVIGPINTPHTFLGADENRSMGKKLSNSDSRFKKILKKFDSSTYFFSIIFTNLSRLTLMSANKIYLSDSTGKKMLASKKIFHTTLAPKTFDTSGFTKKELVINNNINLLNISYLVLRKNTEDLIEMMNILVNEYLMKNIFLTIIGDGPQRANLENRVKEFKINYNISFKGYIPRDQVPEYYKNAQIFVSSSLSESMPSMYFEAMAAGMPLVIAENSCTSDLLNEGVGAIVVRQKNPRQMAEAIKDILDNTDALKDMGEKNYELIKHKYSFEDTMNDFYRSLRSVATNSI